MIELAPNHKFGLPLTNPILIAAGFGGYGDAYHGLLDLSAFGAIVTNPITLRPRRGPAQPRLVETRAGYVLETGQQNPGVRKVIHKYGRMWSRLGAPIIAHLPADEPDDLRRTAGALASTESVAAIELGIPPGGALPADVERWLRAVGAGCHLPRLVRLPLEGAAELAGVVAESAADALVIAGPPPGAASSPRTGAVVRGYLYGPLVHSLVLEAIQAVAEVVALPLVARGGIHTAADVESFLQAGACAVQLDSLLFVDPQAAGDIAVKLSAG
jgi:dihydroorotate dehydrogenase (NAD+) catalytic subunit